MLVEALRAGFGSPPGRLRPLGLSLSISGLEGFGIFSGFWLLCCGSARALGDVVAPYVAGGPNTRDLASFATPFRPRPGPPGDDQVSPRRGVVFGRPVDAFLPNFDPPSERRFIYFLAQIRDGFFDPKIVQKLTVLKRLDRTG